MWALLACLGTDLPYGGGRTKPFPARRDAANSMFTPLTGKPKYRTERARERDRTLQIMAD